MLRVLDLQKFLPSSEWRWRLSSCPPYSAVGSSGGVPPGSAAAHPRGVSRRCPRRNGRRDAPRRPVLTVFAHQKHWKKRHPTLNISRKTRKTTPCWRCKWYQYWIQRTSAIRVSAGVQQESSCCHLVQHDSAPNIVSGVVGVLSINCLDLPFQAGNFESGCLRLVDFFSQTGKCVWRLGDT